MSRGYSGLLSLRGSRLQGYGISSAPHRSMRLKVFTLSFVVVPFLRFRWVLRHNGLYLLFA
jgi:hypothetical protein